MDRPVQERFHFIVVRLSTVATLAAWASVGLSGCAGAAAPDLQFTLSNRFLGRTLALHDGVVRTTAIQNKITGAKVAVESDEFLLQLNNGTNLKTDDFRLAKHSLGKLSQGGQKLTFLLRNQRLGIELEMAFELGSRDFFVRKRLAVRSAAGEQVVLRDVEVERFRTSAKRDLGSFGQPLYLDGSLFLGLEYPAGYNECRDGVVALRHHPGRRLTREFLQCKPAVLGVSPAGKVEEWFQRYVADIRLPPRFFVLYNSWYDIQRDTMSTASFIACHKGFKENLTDKHGVKLDAFVPDDGWQNHKSIWEIDHSLFPHGFSPLVEALNAGGTRLGLWLPLTACQGNLDVKWGVEHGYEADTGQGHYCLSAPNYNRQLREVLRRYVTDYNMIYFKHDFNAFECRAEGHGHLPNSECGTEANVDAYIDMLKFLSGLKPDIFLNVTGGMWLSPWWLAYANTVWMGGRGDWAYEKGLPALEPRDWELNARDADLYSDFRIARNQFPPSSLMYHGIIHGRLALVGGREEPLEKWTDNVVMHLGRGVTMVELYLTPAIVTDAQWTILANALKWARANRDALAETRLVLGNAGKGEVCGYVHRSPDRALLCLRNPVLACQTVTVRLTEELGIEAAEKRRFDVGLLYPYRQVLAQGLQASDSFSLELPGNEVCVAEVFPAGDSPAGGPGVAGCRYALAKSKPGELEYDLLGLPGTKCEATMVGRPRLKRVALEGATVTPKRIQVSFPGSPEQASVEDQRPDEAGKVAASYRITLPGYLSEKAKLILLGQQMSSGVELPVVMVNGVEAPSRIVEGDGWKARVVLLGGGTSEVRWAFSREKQPKVPFQRKTLQSSSWLSLKRPLVSRRLVLTGAFDAATVRGDQLPTPFAAVKTETIPVQPLKAVNLALGESPATVSEDDVRNIVAARLHFSVFGVEGGEYIQKPVLLNGQEVGLLPLNDQPQDRWQERTLDIPKEKLGLLRLTNEVVLTNPTGDCFKVKDLALAVQLLSRVWVETGFDLGVYCSVAGWLYSEGEVFAGARSKPVLLKLPSR